jgi:hypothetical protein
MLFHPDYRIEGPIPLTSEGPIGVEPLRPGELRSVELALVAR